MKNEKPTVGNLAHESFSGAWSIRPASFDRFCRCLSTTIRAMAVDPDEEDDKDKPKISYVNGVAVVPLYGVMMRNPGWLTYFGAVDVDHFAGMVKAAADNPACNAILLDIDSPGGSVTGTPEAAAAVMDARQKKACMAYSGGLMCSAAYWVGAQAQGVYASRSAIVGSIGCYAPIYDYSKYYADMGVAVDVIRSGKYKGGNVDGAPVGDDYKANLQRIVDGFGAAFRADVKAQRSSVKDETMEGQEFLGSDAVGAGLIDSVAGFERAIADAGALAMMRGK